MSLAKYLRYARAQQGGDGFSPGIFDEHFDKYANEGYAAPVDPSSEAVPPPVPYGDLTARQAEDFGVVMMDADKLAQIMRAVEEVERRKGVVVPPSTKTVYADDGGGWPGVTSEYGEVLNFPTRLDLDYGKKMPPMTMPSDFEAVMAPIYPGFRPVHGAGDSGGGGGGGEDTSTKPAGARSSGTRLSSSTSLAGRDPLEREFMAGDAAWDPSDVSPTGLSEPYDWDDPPRLISGWGFADSIPPSPLGDRSARGGSRRGTSSPMTFGARGPVLSRSAPGTPQGRRGALDSLLEDVMGFPESSDRPGSGLDDHVEGGERNTMTWGWGTDPVTEFLMGSAKPRSAGTPSGMAPRSDVRDGATPWIQPLSPLSANPRFQTRGRIVDPKSGSLGRHIATPETASNLTKEDNRPDGVSDLVVGALANGLRTAKNQFVRVLDPETARRDDRTRMDDLSHHVAEVLRIVNDGNVENIDEFVNRADIVVRALETTEGLPGDMDKEVKDARKEIDAYNSNRETGKRAESAATIGQHLKHLETLNGRIGSRVYGKEIVTDDTRRREFGAILKGFNDHVSGKRGGGKNVDLNGYAGLVREWMYGIHSPPELTLDVKDRIDQATRAIEMAPNTAEKKSASLLVRNELEQLRKGLLRKYSSS
eukprot:jgi/Mesvir1/14659/Mv05327-RA.1